MGWIVPELELQKWAFSILKYLKQLTHLLELEWLAVDVNQKLEVTDGQPSRYDPQALLSLIHI